MQNTPFSVYDFPAGYPDFQSLIDEAMGIFERDNYIDNYDYDYDVPQIIIDNLKRPIKNPGSAGENDQPKYFFPITELYLQGKLSMDKIQDQVKETFTRLAKKALKLSYKIEADHIPNTFFLAWGIVHNIFSQAELAKIRFDHGDEKGEYYGQKYVTSYGGPDVHSMVDIISQKITLPENIEQELENQANYKQDLEEIQKKVQKYVCYCDGCPV